LPIAQNYYKQNSLKIFGISNLNVPDKYDHILVKKGSPIKKLSDISGKTLKYALYPGTTHTNFTKDYLKSLGIDISKIEFVQLAPSNHLQALEAGSIDILGTYDPIATTGLATGGFIEIGYSVYAHDFPNTPIGISYVTNDFATNHADLMKKYFGVYDQVYSDIGNKPDATYDFIAKAYNFTPEVAKTIPLPVWMMNRNMDMGNLQKFVDHIASTSEIQKTFDVSTIIVK
jgi:NitT/TauT family transport system substrate-binding protein